MVIDAGIIIIDAAILGLLIGIVWSLKYIAIIDRKIEAMDKKVIKIVDRIEEEERRELAAIDKLAARKKK